MHDLNRNTDKLNWFIDGILLNLVMSCFNISVFGFLLCLFNPRESIFLGQLIPLKYYSFFPQSILISVFHTYILFVHHVSICAVGAVLLIHLSYLNFMVSNELHLRLVKPYRTIFTFRNATNIRIVYRSLQILHQNFVCFMGPFVSLFNGFATMLPIMTNVICLKYWNELSWIIKLLLFTGATMSFSFWILFSQVGKSLWLGGSRNFYSWKIVGFDVDSFEKKAMKKFVRSCKLILIRNGNFLVIGRMNQFIYVKSLILYTCKVWLAIK